MVAAALTNSLVLTNVLFHISANKEIENKIKEECKMTFSKESFQTLSGD